MNFIPVFPLNIVVFPGEQLNLHIFEPRYKQLIKECITEQKPFGIPVVLENTPIELGTLLEVTELVKEYDDGGMDIRTRGIKVFKVLELVKEIPDKLYSGAIVDYPHNVTEKGESTLAQNVVKEVKRLYALLNVEEKFPVKEDSVISYTIGHFVGLNREQEYELLSLFNELQRLEYIRRHLNKITPVLQELEEMKARIKLNGHFRDLSASDLNL